MPESIQIVSLSSVPAGVRTWRSQRRGLASVVACKATYRLVSPVVELALEQDPLTAADVFFDGEARRSSLRSASDWSPFKRRTDVVLVGSAHAPAQTQVRRMVSCLGFGNFEKIVEVRCDRWVGDDGSVHEGAPFTKMPMRWERAGGGPETSNPVGVRAVRDGFGKLPLPNLQPIAFDPAAPDWYVPPVGFAPIAPLWPSRASALGAYASTWSERWIESGLPDDLDFAFFQIAPRDQQIDGCEPNAVLTLENLHPAIDRFSTRLAGHRARALVEPEGLEIEMICDTVVIDTDRLLVTLTWRGSFWESDCPDARRLIVALEPHDSPLPIEALLELAQPADDTVSLSVRAQAPGAIIALPFEATQGAPPTHEPAPSRPPPAPSFGPPPQRVGATLVQPGDDDDEDDEDEDDEKSLPSFETSELLAVVDDPSTDASLHGTAPARPPPPPPHSRAGSIPAPPPPVAAPPPPPASVNASPPPARLSKPPVLVPPAQARKGAASSRRGAGTMSIPAVTGAVPQPPPVAQPAPAPPPRTSQPAPPLPVAQRLGVSAIVGSASSPPPPLAKSAPQRPSVEPVTRSAAVTAPAATVASPTFPPSIGPAPAPPAPAKKPLEKPKKKPLLDLLWYAHGTLAKVRASKEILSRIEDPADDPHTRNEPDRIVGRVLARVAPLDQSGVRSAFLASIDDDGVLVRPLVVIEGELSIAYEPLEIVRSFLALHPPPAKPSPEIAARLRAAEDLAREERPTTTALIDEALSSLRKLDGSSKTEATVLQSLLEERKWYRRGIVGGVHLVGQTTTPNGQHMLTYLPEDAAVRLPLLPTYKVRLLVEPHLRQEQGVEDDLALVVLALARSAEM